MDERENQRLVERIYAAFGRGDMQMILDHLADDVRWSHPGPGAVPWGGFRKGKDQVLEFFSRLSRNVEFLHFSPQEFVTRGSRVVVFGHERMRVIGTGREYEAEWAHAFTLRDGLIVSFQGFTDTARIEEAFAANGDNGRAISSLQAAGT